MNEQAITEAPGTKAAVLLVTGPHGNRPVTASGGWAHWRAADR